MESFIFIRMSTNFISSLFASPPTIVATGETNPSTLSSISEQKCLPSNSGSTANSPNDPPVDPVFTDVHQPDKVFALIADLMRLRDAVEHLKEVFNINLLTQDQREALRELFLATEELYGPPVESDDEEDVEHITEEDSREEKAPTVININQPMPAAVRTMPVGPTTALTGQSPIVVVRTTAPTSRAPRRR